MTETNGGALRRERLLAHAEWLAADEGMQNPFVRCEYDWKEFSRVEFDVCGLGFFELYVNGRRVDEHYFKPVWTDYRARDLSTLLYPLDEETSHRICVLRYDVTAWCEPGRNVFCFLLGNGWYRQDRRNVEGDNRYGRELLLCFEGRVETPGGELRFASREGLFAAEGCVVRNNIYFGEEQDFLRMPPELGGTFRGEEAPLRAVPPPEAELELQDCPNDAVVRVIEPALVREFEDRRIFDAGQNVSGWAELISEGGDVTVRYAEELDALCRLDAASAGGEEQMQKHVYRNFPEGRTLSPLFSWCAFRFFEVRGAGRARVCVVHADVRRSASFRSASAVVGWLFEAYVRTQLNNMHAGVPSDCPHRERLGYTGDGQLVAGAALLALDCRKFFEKWMRDVADCQDLRTGHVQHTAPFYGGGGGPGGWGCAVVTVPWRLYERYGELECFRRYRENMLRWFACMEGFCEDGLVVREREGGWCLGDWCTPEPVRLPEPLVNTYYYIKSMRRFDALEALCGGRPRFRERAEACTAAVGAAYGGLRGQGAEAFLADLGIGGRELIDELCGRYRKEGRFDTGIFGTDVLCAVLAREDRELLFDLLASERFASFGYMKGRGATTLWENWSGEWSHDHPMFGAAVRSLFTGILGIRTDHIRRTVSAFPLLTRGDLAGSLEVAGGTLEVRVEDGKGCVRYDGDYELIT